VIAEKKPAAVKPDEPRRIRILGGLQLLDAALAQTVELRGIEARALERIGEQFDHQGLILREELARHGDRLGSRRCREAATGTFHRIGEREGVA
jgi:hypothetical protein